MGIEHFQRAILYSVQFSCSVLSHSATPWTAARQASLYINNSQSLLKLMSIKLVMLSNHFILCSSLLQIRKRVCQCCILSPCLFNLYAEYIMRNAGLEETQARIKTAGRNINNLRYADDTALMAESEEELKRLLMKVKEESEKVGLISTFRKRRSWHLVPSLHGK